MKTTTIIIAAAAIMPHTAQAWEGGASGDDIIVTGVAQGYLAIDSVTATKTDTPLLDVPQTISVVTREQLDDQSMLSISDVLRYVPGTTVGQGEGNRDQITIRGQNTTADFFLDGVRDDVQYYRPLYNIERVEVLKGPYALIFGRGGGGGIINRVQKTPQADRSFAAATGSINSFGSHMAAIDVNVPISAGAAFRVNGSYEGVESFRDFVDGERFAINPYVAADLGGGWKVGLSYEYVDDDRVPDRGVPSQGNRPITNARDTFFGVPGVNRTTLKAHIAKLRIDGEIAPGLTLSSTILYGDYDKLYTNVFASSAVDANGTVALSAYTDPTQRENLIVQSNLVWDVDFGAVGSKLLLGVEYGDQDTRNSRSDGTLSAPRVSAIAPVYPTVAFATLSRDRQSDVQFFSAYAQDQLSIGDHVELVAGLRYDRFEIKGVDFIPAVDRPFGRTDEKVSPRLGLIVKPVEALSIYGSYSRSFLPRSGEQFLVLSTSDQDLAPEKFTNYEVGVKWALRPDLTLTLAAFQLDRTNATTPDPANPALSIVAGRTRTRGVELGVAGSILPGWQVSGGYSYQDAKLRDNDAVRLAQVPKHQFALWNRYDFNPHVGLGLGVTHQSGQFAAIRTSVNTTRLPAFTRVDAALFYTLSDRFDVQVNLENLLDEAYFLDAHNNNNITPGAPINARLTVRVKI
jgi:catecholate siderophore receptor